MFGWLKRKKAPLPRRSFDNSVQISDNLTTGVRSYRITEDNVAMKARKARDLDPEFSDIIRAFCAAHQVIRTCSLFDVMFPPSSDVKILIAVELDDPAKLTELSPELMFLLQDRREKTRILLGCRESFKLNLDVPDAEFYRRPTP